MNLTEPPANVDVRDLAEYIRPPIRVLNNLQVRVTIGADQEGSGKLDISENNGILTIKLPASFGPRIIPFQLIDVSTSTKNIRIALGWIIDTQNGGKTWIPTGMTAGDAQANWYIINGVSGTGFVWLEVTYLNTSSYNVTSVTINYGSTVPAQTPGTAYFTIGTYDATGASGVLVVGACGLLACASCGGTLNFGSAQA